MATAAARLMAALVLAAGALVACMATRPDLLTERQGGQDSIAGSTLVLAPDRKVEAMRGRASRRAEAVKRLLAGDLTLAETASWFRLFNDGESPPLGGGSESERLCRQVLCWVEAELESATVPASEVRRRLASLEAELARCLAQDGPLLLP